MEIQSDSEYQGMGGYEALLYNIEGTLKIWRQYAHGMIIAHGEEDPGYMVMRKCINDLSLIRPNYNPKDYMA